MQARIGNAHIDVELYGIERSFKIYDNGELKVNIETGKGQLISSGLFMLFFSSISSSFFMFFDIRYDLSEDSSRWFFITCVLICSAASFYYFLSMLIRRRRVRAFSIFGLIVSFLLIVVNILYLTGIIPAILNILQVISVFQ
jgi:hypothetical protein